MLDALRNAFRHTGVGIESGATMGIVGLPALPFTFTSLRSGETTGEFPAPASPHIQRTLSEFQDAFDGGEQTLVYQDAAQVQIAGRALTLEAVYGARIHRSPSSSSTGVIITIDATFDKNPDLVAAQAKAQRTAKTEEYPTHYEVEHGLSVIGKFLADPQSIDGRSVENAVLMTGRKLSWSSWTAPQSQEFVALMENLIAANPQPRDSDEEKWFFLARSHALSWYAAAAQKTGQTNRAGRFLLGQLTPEGRGENWKTENFTIIHAFKKLEYAPAAGKLVRMAEADHGNARTNRYAKLVAGEALLKLGRIGEGRKFVLEGLEMTLREPLEQHDVSEFMRILSDHFRGTAFKDVVATLEAKGIFTPNPLIPEFKEGAKILMRDLMFQFPKEDFDGLVKRILTSGEEVIPELYVAALTYDVEGWI